MEIFNLIKPLGIATYALVLIALLTGLRVIKVPVKWHRLIAIVALAAATVHAVIVIYLAYL
jgi:uncharacterized membrane protein